MNSNKSGKRGINVLQSMTPDILEQVKCEFSALRSGYSSLHELRKDGYLKRSSIRDKNRKLGFHSSPSKPSTTEETNVRYDKKADSLIQQFEEETGRSAIDSLEHLMLWLIVRKQLIATNTWKFDKYALIHCAQDRGLHHLPELLRLTNTKGGKDHRRKVPASEARTSAKKLKVIKQWEFEKIMQSYHTHCTGHWSYVGFWLFYLIYHVGMRPIEVTQSRCGYFKDDNGRSRYGIKIKNAKHTNGRGNGEYRILFIDHFSKVQQQQFRATIHRASTPRHANGSPMTPKEYAKAASQGFSRYMKKLFPRRIRNITLYSARHQFAADAKKSGFTPAQVAALMGHASDATSSRNYAKRRSGRSTGRIQPPLKSQVATVRRVMRPYRAKKAATSRPAIHMSHNK